MPRPSSSSSRPLSWLSEACYVVLVLITVCFFAISLAALLSQAVRTAPHRWTNNGNAVTIGATYVLVCLVSVALCIRRRVAVRRRLQRISKTYGTVDQSPAPKPVHEYVSQEFCRACLVSYECQPRGVEHAGWGRPGTEYSGVRLRRALLDTIADVDAQAHLVIPSHPQLRPHARMLQHFRFILPLLPRDEGGLTSLHYYDSAVQLARTSRREPSEQAFRIGMHAANKIKRTLNECRIEMLEGSSDRLASNT